MYSLIAQTPHVWVDEGEIFVKGSDEFFIKKDSKNLWNVGMKIDYNFSTTCPYLRARDTSFDNKSDAMCAARLYYHDFEAGLANSELERSKSKPKNKIKNFFGNILK